MKMAEYQHFDGETFITFDIVSVNERTNEVQVAVTNRGKISVITYDLYADENGEYFEYGCNYEKIYLDDFMEA